MFRILSSCLLGVLLMGHVVTTGCAATDRTDRQQMTTIHGTVTYRQRIALPPGAEVIVVLADADYQPVARQRFQTDGRQVPLPYVLLYDRGKLDSAGQYYLRAMIQIDGRTRWREIEPVPVKAAEIISEAVEIVVQPVGAG